MKQDFYIDRVTKKELEPLFLTHHYLKDESKILSLGITMDFSNILTGNALLILAAVLVGLFSLVSQFQKLP
jgi:F0F1-type ATP synthase membrane subunit a